MHLFFFVLSWFYLNKEGANWIKLYVTFQINDTGQLKTL